LPVRMIVEQVSGSAWAECPNGVESAYITTQADIGKLHMRNTSGTTVKSSTGKYSLTVDTVANDGGYRLIANQAFNDLDCGNLTLTANGEKGRTGSKKSVAECWR
ncbi:hypothetical protein V2B00_27820, partial [Pseudomonas aeruginosa]